MIAEQRQFKRAPISIKLRLRESGTDVAASFDSRDISEGGVFVRSSLLWEPGERFELRFTLPGAEREIRVTGEVARAEDKYLLFPDLADRQPPVPGMGIRFLDITDEDRRLIRQFLERTERR